MNSSSQGSLKETDPKAYLEQIIQTFLLTLCRMPVRRLCIVLI